MSYCKGECEYLNCKTHTCELTGEKLTYMKQTGLVSFTVHEHEGICEKEEGRQDARQIFIPCKAD